MPNLLLIAGNGRNVGKTFLACEIIKQLSVFADVIGLKISPHFHDYNSDDILFKSDNFIILNERQINSKDSSLMLQAGAKQVFFIMVKHTHLNSAFEYIKKHLSNKIVVCESAGLIEIIKPAHFLFVKRAVQNIVKKHHLEYSPLIVNNDGTNFDFDINSIVKNLINLNSIK